MKRLLPRPPRRRAKRSQEADGAASPEAQPTEVRPAVPAGAEPVDPAAPPQPTFRNRGRLRRRMRFLRRVRELGFRDLGGLVFDQHKFPPPNPHLGRPKVTAPPAGRAGGRAPPPTLRARRATTPRRQARTSAR